MCMVFTREIHRDNHTAHAPNVAVSTPLGGGHATSGTFPSLPSYTLQSSRQSTGPVVRSMQGGSFQMTDAHIEDVSFKVLEPSLIGVASAGNNDQLYPDNTCIFIIHDMPALSYSLNSGTPGIFPCSLQDHTRPFPNHGPNDVISGPMLNVHVSDSTITNSIQ